MKGGFEEAVKKVKRQTLLARAGYKSLTICGTWI
jgi:hypothetical protein